MNLTILIHLALASLGMYMLMLYIFKTLEAEKGARICGAFAAAMIFTYNSFNVNDYFNFVTYGAAHALGPWAILASLHILYGQSPRRWSGLLALLLALQVLSGGLYVFVYTNLGLALLFFFLGILGKPIARKRALLYGALAVIVAGLIILAKALPYSSWITLTNRADPVGLDSARGVTLAGYHDFDWHTLISNLYYNTYFGLALFLSVFSLPLLRHSLVRLIAGLVLLGTLISLGVLHPFLYNYVPPFDKIRMSYRAWTLANLYLPIAAGLGFHFIASYFYLRVPKPASLSITLLFFVLLFMLPFTDGREAALSIKNPDSLDQVVERYPNWNRIARERDGEWRAVCLDVKTPDDRNEQFIATALGIDIVAGFFGDAWCKAYAKHVYPRGMPKPKRLRRLKVLSVRYCVEGDGLGENTIADSKIYEYPRGIDGKTIEELPDARPRAFVPPRVCALIDDPQRKVLYALLDGKGFRPDRASLLSFDANELPSEEEIGSIDEIIYVEGTHTRSANFKKILSSAKAHGIRITKINLPMKKKEKDLLVEVNERLSSTREPMINRKAGFERKSFNKAVISRVDPTRGEYIILSETWSIYGGWTVRSGEKDLPIRSADGVVSAVYFPPGVSTAVAAYRPREVLHGLLFGALGLLIAILLLMPFTIKG